MDDNEIHQWLLDCFGPIQGEMAWNQISQLPEEIREQLTNQGSGKLPKPSEVKALMQAFSAGGLNTMGDMQRTVNEGPINIKLASSMALQQANDEQSQHEVKAEDAQAIRRAMSEANLWLDTACSFDPAPGEPKALTRAGWVEDTLDAWGKFAAPVAQSMNDALSSVLSERLGDSFQGEISGIFAGPVPIPIPENMKDPAQLIKLLGNTSFAMQLGHAAGELSHEVRGSFDQGIALSNNAAGALIAQNAMEYAKSLDIDQQEVLSFLSLQEVAHARLFADVQWLMPRFEALIGKYARGVNIDLDAMEEQLREASAMDPESISGAVNLTNVAIPDTPEQQEALSSLENLLALVEGWVDCVAWHAGMAHIPHIEQLREMLRRERAVGGPAERTFENLLGMQLRPKRMREAAALWERISDYEGIESRDAKWSHPDLLPVLPPDDAVDGDMSTASTSDEPSAIQAADSSTQTGESTSSSSKDDGIDWDAELSKLLEESDIDDTGNENGTDDEDGTDDDASQTDTPDSYSDHGSDDTSDSSGDTGDTHNTSGNATDTDAIDKNNTDNGTDDGKGDAN